MFQIMPVVNAIITKSDLISGNFTNEHYGGFHCSLPGEPWLILVHGIIRNRVRNSQQICGSVDFDRLRSNENVAPRVQEG
ncbi:MAG TPA: hypothetical protein VF649_09420 [Sphingomonas sp.]|jgi:hypothetical protein|uniref:hypothetical protein n=1 Tax=Sphingomonas sp. TaxID=28214 RepID=UPI002ED9A10D